MKEEMKSELQRLPYAIGKVIGGLFAVIGFGAAVYIYTHRAAPSLSDIASPVLAGIAGLIVFLVSSWLNARKSRDDGRSEHAGKAGKRANTFSWIVLLVLAALFVAFVLIKAG